jgi:hypothetical protein
MNDEAILTPKFAKGNVVSLQSLGVNEAYLEKFIVTDPTVLGLGDVFVVERQRRHEKAGRLDLLLQDDAGEIRYVVELMLGSADESHLIRTIEYWDIERRRYPAYDHRAVLIAEDITTRFLNVISLFSGSIPIIAIHVKAIGIDNKIAVTFLRVLDSTVLRKDDQVAIANPADRGYWTNRVGTEIVELADKCLSFINQTASRPRSFNYNKSFIGLTDGFRVNNFVWFNPKISFLRVGISLDPVELWEKRLDEAGLDFNSRGDGTIRVKLTTKGMAESGELIRELLQESVSEDEKD